MEPRKNYGFDIFPFYRSLCYKKDVMDMWIMFYFEEILVYHESSLEGFHCSDSHLYWCIVKINFHNIQ